MKKKIMYLMVTFLYICVIVTSITYGKFSFVYTGIIWQVDFSQFTQIRDAYIIKNPDGEGSGKLFGPNESVKGNNGFYRITQEEFEAGVNDLYDIDALKNNEFSLYNSTNQVMLVTFSIYYYSQKEEKNSNIVTCSIYNSSTHGKLTDAQAKSANETRTLKVEFYEAVGTGNESDPTGDHFSNIVNTTTWRTGDPDQLDESYIIVFFTAHRYYYAHKANVNPKTIIDKTNSSTGFAPAPSITDFLIMPGTTEHYNISIYYGSSFGNDSGDKRLAFISAIEINAVPYTG